MSILVSCLRMRCFLMSASSGSARARLYSLDEYCARHGQDLPQLQLEVFRALQQWMSQDAALAVTERQRLSASLLQMLSEADGREDRAVPETVPPIQRALAANARTIGGCSCSVCSEEREAFGGAGGMCCCGIHGEVSEACRGAGGSVVPVR
jgi:hypothetical protein